MSRIIYCGLDEETTGLDVHKGHRIIEIALKFRDHDGNRIGGWTQRINPERGIDPDAQKVHGISYEDLLDKPKLEDVADKIVALLSRANYVIAHNGEGFDLEFLAYELLRVGRQLPPIYSVDTMLQGRWATPDGSLPSLEMLAFSSGVAYDKEAAHAADYDVDVMLDCFDFARNRGGLIYLPTSPWVCPSPPKAKTK